MTQFSSHIIILGSSSFSGEPCGLFGLFQEPMCEYSGDMEV